MSTLYLVATPIGNLKDITLRALEVLQEVTLIAAEDTRHTGKLLSAHAISTPLISYHEHNKDAREERMISALNHGDVALVSDAGTPVVSDPGYELVGLALDQGHSVVPIPGPSAPITALIASGLPADSFTFIGYLPRRKAERKTVLQAFASRRETLLMFEVPHRLRASLADLEAIFGPGRKVAVCREMTKLHEDVQRGTLSDIIDHFQKIEPRGEITLVIAGARAEDVRWSQERVNEELMLRISAGESRSSAAKVVASLSGWKRQELYRMSMEE